MSVPPATDAVGATDADRAQSPPDYDPKAVGRVGIRVKIETVELVGATFSRASAEPLEVGDEKGFPPETALKIDWKASEDRRRVGCVITFGTVFNDSEPYSLAASFRARYTIEGEAEPPSLSDLENFVHWNAILNVWPYWREYLASTVNRAGLPRFVVPVMRLPVPGMEDQP